MGGRKNIIEADVEDEYAEERTIRNDLEGEEEMDSVDQVDYV